MYNTEKKSLLTPHMAELKYFFNFTVGCGHFPT